MLKYLVPALVLSTAAFADDKAFVDITESSGIDFRHWGPVVDERLKNLGPWFTALGAGGAMGDVNHDGYPDLYLTNSLAGHDNVLWINNGDMTFTEAAKDWGVAEVNNKDTFSMMALIVDFDNDGFNDLFVARFGPSLLYRNIDGERFELVENAFDGMEGHRNPVAAVALDYDRDGDLDIYLGNYFPDVDLTNLTGDTQILHESWEGARNGGTNRLLRNDGDMTFTDVTEESGLGDTGWSLAIGTGDLDLDGWTDLYVANDFGTDKMFRNRGDGTFEDMTLHSIGVDTKKGMNAELGDYDNDGLLDIYVTNITEPYLNECNMLWHNNGDFTFSDVSTILGVCDTKWGWGAKFIDYDNDGWQDVYVMNGFISGGSKDYIDILMPIMLDSEVDLGDTMSWPPLEGMSFSGYERNVMFKNIEGFEFVDVSAENGVDIEMDGRGLMVGDLDLDGDQELVVLNANQKAVIFDNRAEKVGNWISLQLEGVASNRSAIGTRVTAYTQLGLHHRETNAGNGFESQSSTEVHLGLGEVETLAEMEVLWPSGSSQYFTDIAVNTRYRLTEGGELEILPTTENKE
ncbi:MAG: CRTAC1 family protein [Mangrovicoccus sp.]